MLNQFLNTFRVKLPANDQIAFHKILDKENAERAFGISLIGVLFFFLLMVADFQRIYRDTLFDSWFYQANMAMHICLGLFVIPAFFLQRHSKAILLGTYRYVRLIVYGVVALLAFTLIPMALFATKDRNSLMTFVVYMIFINLFLTLPKKVLYRVNFISFLLIALGVFLLEKNNPIILTAALLEALGVSIPVLIIGSYQYHSRVNQYLNELRIQEQNNTIQQALKEDFEQKLVQIEMRALRAQMNPHFIFNVLNSIKLYMIQNDPTTAANYLTKFSKLIRLILNNSKSQMILLEDELESLKLYIEIESFRFNHQFLYTIELSKLVDTEFVEIPPMILQPYVENAIWHGLMHKREERGKLLIKVDMDEEDRLTFVIEDNGIGRKKAAELNSNTARKRQHKSVGMELTADRIAITNQYYGTDASVEIIDLFNQNGDAAGTRVVVKLPTA